MPVIVVHGGASKKPANKIEIIMKEVKNACKAGHNILKAKGSALNAAVEAVKVMEDHPYFNAGYGSSLNINGSVEMDALVMNGANLEVGAVGAVTRIKNPVCLARLVMEKSNHCLFVADGAHEFANRHKVRLISPKELIHEESMERLEYYKTFETTIDKALKQQTKDHDTVGAVAIDEYGHLACATSTGGITGKLKGRVGDTPIPGSGGWADDKCAAISTTGHGEAIMRVALARHIAGLIDGGASTENAIRKGLEYMKEKVDGYGGAIALNHREELGIYFTTQHMPWASIQDDIEVNYGYKSGEVLTDHL